MQGHSRRVTAINIGWTPAMGITFVVWKWSVKRHFTSLRETFIVTVQVYGHKSCATCGHGIHHPVLLKSAAWPRRLGVQQDISPLWPLHVAVSCCARVVHCCARMLLALSHAHPPAPSGCTRAAAPGNSSAAEVLHVACLMDGHHQQDVLLSLCFWTLEEITVITALELCLQTHML